MVPVSEWPATPSDAYDAIRQNWGQLEKTLENGLDSNHCGICSQNKPMRSLAIILNDGFNYGWKFKKRDRGSISQMLVSHLVIFLLITSKSKLRPTRNGPMAAW